MNEYLLGALALIVLFAGVAVGIEIVDERDTRRIAKQACYDAGYVEVMRSGERWYCTRKRAGNDEIIEVRRLAAVAP